MRIAFIRILNAPRNTPSVYQDQEYASGEWASIVEGKRNGPLGEYEILTITMRFGDHVIEIPRWECEVHYCETKQIK